MKNYFLIFIAVVLSLACSKIIKKPIVQVGKYKLYEDDIKKILPKSYSYEDSINFVENYINNWIYTQILYIEAQKKFKNNEEIEQKVKDFKKSLYIHELKQQLISENFDTIITEDQINQYYQSHYTDFLLNEPVIKGIYLKVPISMNINEINQILQSNQQGQIEKLINKIKQNNGTVINFADKWEYLSNFQVYFKQPLKPNKKIYQETSDDSYHIIKINEYIPAGNPMPLQMCYNDIKRILINKKSTEFFEKYQSELYKKYLEKGKIKFF